MYACKMAQIYNNKRTEYIWDERRRKKKNENETAHTPTVQWSTKSNDKICSVGPFNRCENIHCICTGLRAADDNGRIIMNFLQIGLVNGSRPWIERSKFTCFPGSCVLCAFRIFLGSIHMHGRWWTATTSQILLFVSSLLCLLKRQWLNFASDEWEICREIRYRYILSNGSGQPYFLVNRTSNWIYVFHFDSHNFTDHRSSQLTISSQMPLVVWLNYILYIRAGKDKPTTSITAHHTHVCTAHCLVISAPMSFVRSRIEQHFKFYYLNFVSCRKPQSAINRRMAERPLPTGHLVWRNLENIDLPNRCHYNLKRGTISAVQPRNITSHFQFGLMKIFD